jgi:hypothetical protein
MRREMQTLAQAHALPPLRDVPQIPQSNKERRQMFEPISMGKMIAGPVMGSLAAVVLDGASYMPLGAAAGVILTVVMLTRRWTKLEDSQQEMIARQQDMSTRLSKIEKLIETRPCVGNGKNCPVEKDDE